MKYNNGYIHNNDGMNEENAFNCVKQREIKKKRIATPFEITAYKRSRARKSSCTVPCDLKIALDAEVMLLKNVDPNEKLINGSRGKIVGWVTNQIDMVTEIYVKFEGIGRHAITKQICDSVAFENGKIIDFYQFPLKLSWAATAHKSQGQTLDRVAINISDNCFAHGALYVALSRVRSLNDIVFFGQDKWPENGLCFHVNNFIRDRIINNEWFFVVGFWL